MESKRIYVRAYILQDLTFFHVGFLLARLLVRWLVRMLAWILAYLFNYLVLVLVRSSHCLIESLLETMQRWELWKDNGTRVNGCIEKGPLPEDLLYGLWQIFPAYKPQVGPCDRAFSPRFRRDFDAPPNRHTTSGSGWRWNRGFRFPVSSFSGQLSFVTSNKMCHLCIGVKWTTLIVNVFDKYF